MSPSPALRRFLAEMEFPATKDDLLREAVRDGLDSALRLTRPTADTLVAA